MFSASVISSAIANNPPGPARSTCLGACVSGHPFEPGIQRAIVTVMDVMVEKGRALLRIQCRVCECVVAEARLLLQSGGLKTL
jgi:hypothetical protein